MPPHPTPAPGHAGYSYTAAAAEAELRRVSRAATAAAAAATVRAPPRAEYLCGGGFNGYTLPPVGAALGAGAALPLPRLWAIQPQVRGARESACGCECARALACHVCARALIDVMFVHAR